jgi:hypothetical protein
MDKHARVCAEVEFDLKIKADEILHRQPYLLYGSTIDSKHFAFGQVSLFR